MSAKSNAPVIIKRKKVVGGGGHHGGAWKVAYADFVTAMMAFFLLMWLLNATTEKQRKGIADYFNPTIPINRISGGGEGSFGGTNIFSERVLAHNGTGASARFPTEEFQARGATGTDSTREEAAAAAQAETALREIEETLNARGGESMASRGLMRHIVTRVTDEGLIVELFDLPGRALFEPDGDTPTPLMEALVQLVGEVFALAVNPIAVQAHLRARPLVAAESVAAWELSSRRAHRSRQMLEATGLPPQRIQRVTGYADRKPAARDPMAVRNNRVELILLREVR
ncbi:chemotaxis protein MotB [Meinhardsimonia xiamenensis]|jgi:chemotaxis protein MotB|uniref:Chemotaxis protein MotB n=1 Tax=Meinhardsimonia xiamenensis TaxID=990712 RepID=A0A1G8YZH0_9RHOB|nr:flagellar motor protein MotB [Meinhardsimonia xiamenensis]PRX37494.1 chemotaxis protein MotB [Meinhardsimonia xiamenensis]SDK08181.1 chemotaxis protein MotB [Meinhardsimonia xiamenensis]